MKAERLNISNSEELWKSIIEIVPGGAQTFSKAPNQYVNGVAPKFIERAKGAHVWDVDGNEYIDYTLGLGPVTLGYCYAEVDRAIIEQLRKGITFPLINPLELEVVEMIKEIVPCAQMVKFAKNGSDVTTAALRICRAYTNRDLVAVCGYHGWHDWYIGSTIRNCGVPKATQDLTLKFKYNDIESLKKLFKEHPGKIACIVMEPVEFEPPQKGFLESVKEIAHANGALLVFDEVIMGFRLAIGGAQEYYGVTPDLATLGKGIANGMPLSVLCGNKDVMKLFEEVFFSGTFFAETLSLAAAKATIDIFRREPVIKHIAQIGGQIKKGFNALIEDLNMTEVVKCVGLDCWLAFSFSAVSPWTSKQIQSLFQQEIVRRGILTRPGMMLCYSHSGDDATRTLDVFHSSLEVVKEALGTGKVEEWLDGSVITTIIREPGKDKKLT